MERSVGEREPIMVFGCTACAIGSFVTTVAPPGIMTKRYMSFAFALLWCCYRILEAQKWTDGIGRRFGNE